ncbi:MAG TPA: CapA family protein [bacterium]|nr:CapA family protein [bacterium]HPV65283.1 CapA family protein [bacterium]
MKRKKLVLMIFGFLLSILIFLFSFESINQTEKQNKDNNIIFFGKKDKEEIIKPKEVLEETKKIEENSDLNFLFFGDLMLGRHVGEKIDIHGLDYLFEKLEVEKFTEKYDFVMANLEGATTNEGKHYKPDNLYDFAFKPETINNLKKYNFNIFALSNNHLSDQGEKGISETYQNLSELGFNYFGCKDGYLSSSENTEIIYKANENEKQKILNENDCSSIIIETKNKKIAFFSFSIVYSDIEENLILNKIDQIKKQSDFLIISPHWGVEYQEKANKKQENLAKKMIDSGADLIIGHHPHVIQNWEIYKEKPIFYSLGNFIFDQYFSPETQEGLAISIKVDNNKIDKTIYKIKTKGSKIEEIIKIE